MLYNSWYQRIIWTWELHRNWIWIDQSVKICKFGFGQDHVFGNDNSIFQLCYQCLFHFFIGKFSLIVFVFILSNIIIIMMSMCRIGHLTIIGQSYCLLLAKAKDCLLRYKVTFYNIITLLACNWELPGYYCQIYSHPGSFYLQIWNFWKSIIDQVSLKHK